MNFCAKCGGLNMPDFSEEVMKQVCITCGSSSEAGPRDTLIKSGVFVDESSEGSVRDAKLKYKTLIMNSARDRAANVVHVKCQCGFPIMHQVRVGPNAVVINICPECGKS